MKIGKYTIKKVVDFEDHEGFLITQGSVYKGNKEIGKYSQDYMAGPTTVDIYDENDQKDFLDFAKEWVKKNPNGIRKPTDKRELDRHGYTLAALYEGEEDVAIIEQLISLRYIEQNWRRMANNKKNPCPYYVLTIDHNGREKNFYAPNIIVANSVGDRDDVADFVVYGKEDFDIE